MEQSISYCCISWDLHKSFMSNGFSHLQKNEEFVDMTIAADGHLVKVHQNIIALASPYIKEMLHSASCPHPVMFLNNVTHRVLSYILEYIYAGEVNIPTEDMDAFIEASKALKIKGVENVSRVNMPNQVFLQDDYIESEEIDNIEQTQIDADDNSNCAAHITINSSNYQVNVHKATKQENEDIKSETNGLTNNLMEVSPKDVPSQSTDDYNIKTLPDSRNNAPELTEKDCYDTDNGASHVSDECETLNVKEKRNKKKNTPFLKSIAVKGDLKIKDITPQYTISNRGALQLILNRYMYLCHHQAYGGRRRRWRCVDYRKMQCPAIVDTMGENVTNRIGLHSHGFHDIKILKKYRKHAVYTTISRAEEINNVNKGESDEDDVKG